MICKLLISWLPGTDYSRCALTLRVALRANRRRCAASSNRLVYVGGSNYDRMTLGANPGYFKFFVGWLPGTEPKSNRKDLEFKGLLISHWCGYPSSTPS